MERETLEVLLGQGLSVERIAQRFGKHPSTVSYWMKKYGLVSPRRERHAPKGGLEEATLRDLTEHGLSIAEIAISVGRSKATVRYWLGRYGLRTSLAFRQGSTPAARAAAAARLARAPMHCSVHGLTEFILEGRGYYRCAQCRSEAVTARRRRVKSVLVAEAGGRCARCGYAACQAALHFHHLDPAQKRLVVSAYGQGLGLEVLRAEAAKCVLLCANCHAEVESGLPLDLGTMGESDP
jgi:transposase/DNA-directed RNA polymerase subunit RPC12/RpoP